MREKLNENPMAQVGLVAVLLVAAAILMMTTLKGGSEEEGEEAVAPAPAAPAPIATGEVGSGAQLPPLPPPGAGAPPSPRPVVAAFEANETVVVLFVRTGGTDDRLTLAASRRLEGAPDVAFFAVPVDEISRYAAIAQGVDVNRVPALVVVQPKRLSSGVPAASVQYGFQSAESIVQAVVDAGYKGPTLTYHP